MIPVRNRTVSNLSKEQFIRLAIRQTVPKSRLNLYREVQAALGIYKEHLIMQLSKDFNNYSNKKIFNLFEKEQMAADAYDLLQSNSMIDNSIVKEEDLGPLWIGCRE